MDSSRDLNTLFLGKVLLRYDRLDSTNAEAERLLKAGTPAEGTVILAREQFEGKGQAENGWFTSPGKNLTLSIILYPKFLEPKSQFHLNMVVSLAVLRTLEAYEIVSKVKWPNDVMAQEKKLAGILIRNSLTGKGIKHCVIGIGLNVNQDPFPEDLPKAGSMKTISGNIFSLDDVRKTLLENLEKYYLLLKSGKKNAILIAYLENLFGMNEERLFSDPEGNRFTGKIVGVDGSGRLLVNTRQRTLTFFNKEIIFL